MILPFTNQIWFYPKVIDFRKQLNGLMLLVVDELGRNPGSGELFVFRDRTGKKLKIIYFDGQCFWLLACRLEQGRFKLPKKDDVALSISYDQLTWLLSGLSMQDYQQNPIKKYEYYA
jgi:transposase